MRLNNNIAIVVFMCTFFMCCNKRGKESETFYYDVYSSKKEVITAYYRTISTYEQDTRIDSITRFDLEGNIVDEQIEKYIITKDTLYKIDFNNNSYPYLIIDMKNCNLMDKAEEVKTCLINSEDYLIFTEQTLVTDGVKKKLTYDEKFNLIENEYLNGYLNYYKISKRDVKPDILKK